VLKIQRIRLNTILKVPLKKEEKKLKPRLKRFLLKSRTKQHWFSPNVWCKVVIKRCIQVQEKGCSQKMHIQVLESQSLWGGEGKGGFCEGGFKVLDLRCKRY